MPHSKYAFHELQKEYVTASDEKSTNGGHRGLRQNLSLFSYDKIFYPPDEI